MSDTTHPSNYPLTLSKLYRAIYGGRASSVAELIYFGDKIIEGFKLVEDKDYQIRNTSFTPNKHAEELSKIRFNAPFFNKDLYDRLCKNGITIPENYMNYKYINRAGSAIPEPAQLQPKQLDPNQVAFIASVPRVENKSLEMPHLSDSASLPTEGLKHLDLSHPDFKDARAEISNLLGIQKADLIEKVTAAQVKLIDLLEDTGSEAQSIPEVASNQLELFGDEDPGVAVPEAEKVEDIVSQDITPETHRCFMSEYEDRTTRIIDAIAKATEESFKDLTQRLMDLDSRVMSIWQYITRSTKREIAIEANVERLMTAYNDISTVLRKTADSNELGMKAIQDTFKDLGGALKGIVSCLDVINKKLTAPVNNVTNVVAAPPLTLKTPIPKDHTKSLNYHKKINNFDAPTVIINNCVVFRDPSLAECVWDTEHSIYTLNLPKDFEPISWIIDRLNKFPDSELPSGGREFMRDYFFRSSSPANLKVNREAVQHNRVVFSRYIQDFLATNKISYPNGIYIGLIYPKDIDTNQAPEIAAPVYLRAYPKLDQVSLVRILSSFIQSERGIKKDFANANR